MSRFRSFVYITTLLAAALVASACGAHPLAPSDVSAPKSATSASSPAYSVTDPVTPSGVTVDFPPTEGSVIPRVGFVDATSFPLSVPAELIPFWGIRGANTPLLIKQMVFGEHFAVFPNPGQHSLQVLRRDAEIVYPRDLPADKINVILRTATRGEIAARKVGKVIKITVRSEDEPPTMGAVQIPIRFELRVARAVSSQTIDLDGSIVGGYIVYHDISWVDDATTLHELGHMLGLEHHSGEGVMGSWRVDIGGPNSLFFSSAELDNLAMMFRAEPGMEYPGDTIIPHATTTPTSTALRRR